MEMRRSVDQYAEKEQHIPTSLDELVSRKYIKNIPVDPFTDSSFSWILERDEHGGIVDIHSGSQRLGSNGKPYREW
jgi:general secretion pathway protein G